MITTTIDKKFAYTQRPKLTSDCTWHMLRSSGQACAAVAQLGWGCVAHRAPHRSRRARGHSFAALLYSTLHNPSVLAWSTCGSCRCLALCFGHKVGQDQLVLTAASSQGSISSVCRYKASVPAGLMLEEFVQPRGSSCAWRHDA